MVCAAEMGYGRWSYLFSAMTLQWYLYISYIVDKNAMGDCEKQVPTKGSQWEVPDRRGKVESEQTGIMERAFCKALTVRALIPHMALNFKSGDAAVVVLDEAGVLASGRGNGLRGCDGTCACPAHATLWLNLQGSQIFLDGDHRCFSGSVYIQTILQHHFPPCFVTLLLLGNVLQ